MFRRQKKIPKLYFSRTTSDDTLIDPKNPEREEKLKRTVQRVIKLDLDDKEFVDDFAKRLAKAGVDTSIDERCEVQSGDGRLVFARIQEIDPKKSSGQWTLSDSLSVSFEPMKPIELREFLQLVSTRGKALIYSMNSPSWKYFPPENMGQVSSHG